MENEEIVKRLNVLINLALKQQKELPVNKKNMKKIVEFLVLNGITDYKEISAIIEANNPKSVGNILTSLKGKKDSRKSVSEGE